MNKNFIADDYDEDVVLEDVEIYEGDPDEAARTNQYGDHDDELPVIAEEEQS